MGGCAAVYRARLTGRLRTAHEMFGDRRPVRPTQACLPEDFGSVTERRHLSSFRCASAMASLCLAPTGFPTDSDYSESVTASFVRFLFGRDDLLRTRFAISPLIELVAATYVVR